MPQSRPSLLIALLLGSALSCGCGDDGSAPLFISWSFDVEGGTGGDCAALGIERIEATITGSRVIQREFLCADGLAPQAVELGPFDPSLLTIELDAVSADGVILYQGGGRLDVPRETEGVIRLQAAAEP